MIRGTGKNQGECRQGSSLAKGPKAGPAHKTFEMKRKLEALHRNEAY